MCKYEMHSKERGCLCGAYYESNRKDKKQWAHFPSCESKNCPYLHIELLEGDEL